MHPQIVVSEIINNGERPFLVVSTGTYSVEWAPEIVVSTTRKSGESSIYSRVRGQLVVSLHKNEW